MSSLLKIPSLKKSESPEKRKLKRVVREILRELGFSSFYHSAAAYIDTKLSDEQAGRIIKIVLEVLDDGKGKPARQSGAKGR